MDVQQSSALVEFERYSWFLNWILTLIIDLFVPIDVSDKRSNKEMFHKAWKELEHQTYEASFRRGQVLFVEAQWEGLGSLQGFSTKT